MTKLSGSVNFFDQPVGFDQFLTDLSGSVNFFYQTFGGKIYDTHVKRKCSGNKVV